MHDGNWDNGMNNGMNNGAWGWVLMVVMMVAFIGALIWIGTALIRASHHTSAAPGPTASPTAVAPAAARVTPQELLAERLARGEIEPDDYRQRLDALRSSTNG